MAWDKTRCEEGILAPDLNDAIRANYEAIESDLNREHQFSTGGTPADQIIHRQGSARCYYQATAPATRISGDAFDSTDNGSLWVDSDDNKTYILTDYSGPTWTSIESVSIATLLAASRTFAEAITFSKAAVFSVSPTFTEGIVANNSYLQARNAANDGNVDLIKADGSDVPTLPDASALATSATPVGNAKIANVKFVNDQVAAGADPAYSGGQSHTFPGGLIIKMGEVDLASSTTDTTVTFGTAFPTACIAVVPGVRQSSGYQMTYTASVFTISKDSFHFALTKAANVNGITWIAIGH